MFPSPVVLSLVLLTGSDSTVVDGRVIEQSAADRTSTESTSTVVPRQPVDPRTVATTFEALSSPSKSGAIRLGDVDGWRVVVGPFKSWGECHRKLNEQIEHAVNEYIDDYLQHPGSGEQIHIAAAYIRSELLVGEPQRNVVQSKLVGNMCQLTAVLRFDQPFLIVIDRRWHAIRVQTRLLQVALLSGMVFLLLATSYGYLKLDAASRGRYVRRLQFAAVTVILALVVAGVLIARWIPWI